MWQASYPTAVGVVCHANRSLLADRDGNESPATAVAVVCPPRKRGPRAVAGVLVALVTAAWGNQCDVTVVYMVTIARTHKEKRRR